MPKNSLDFSEESLADLEAILDFIAKDSIQNALAYIDRLENDINRLADSPYLGMDCKRKRVRRDCRVLIVESHLVFYGYDKTKSTVRILRDRQDYKRML